MLISRANAALFARAAQSENLQKKSFNIQTQYKIIKILRAIEEEDKLISEIILKAIDDLCEKDENGQAIIENGNHKIIEGKMEICQQRILEIEEAKIQLPDIYFSLDELEGLNLTLEEFNAFSNFIK